MRTARHSKGVSFLEISDGSCFAGLQVAVEPDLPNFESEVRHLRSGCAVAISRASFEYPVKRGVDLQSEHERYLAEEHIQRPVIVTDYPVGIKAFYMYLNDDEKTVRAMDVLVPKVGEIIGGAQREDRLDVLKRRMQEAGLSEDHYWWYLDVRRYGSVPRRGSPKGLTLRPSIGRRARFVANTSYAPVALKGTPERFVVVDLAIENESDGPVLIEDRLPAVLDTDDAQPPHADPGMLIGIDPHLIRPTVE